MVEIKALSGLDNSHLAQVVGYLAVTGCPMGLLINFGRRSLQYRRILPPRNISEHRIKQFAFSNLFPKSVDSNPLAPISQGRFS